RGAAGSVSGVRSEQSGTVSDVGGTGARAVTSDPAPARARTAAAAVDLLPVLALLVGALVVGVAWAWPWWSPRVLVAVAVGWIGLLWWGATVEGRTIGKRILGLTEITESAGGVPGAASALARLLARGGLCLGTLGIAGL